MKKIILLCAGGMSTSMLVKNMQQAAARLRRSRRPTRKTRRPTLTAFFSDRRFASQKAKSLRLARACRLTLST